VAKDSRKLVVEGLQRAVASPTGAPLYATKRGTGLFPAGAAAKSVARQCLDNGLLAVVRSEKIGRQTLPVCSVTPKGVAFLLEQLSPADELAACVRALAAHGQNEAGLFAAAQESYASWTELRRRADALLHPRLGGPTCQSAIHQQAPPVLFPSCCSWKSKLLEALSEWRRSRPQEDCPLPELYRRTGAVLPGLTMGKFHDGIRLLHSQGEVALYPWTGPLHEIPEPAYAMLVGHAVAYYANLAKPRS